MQIESTDPLVCFTELELTRFTKSQCATLIPKCDVVVKLMKTHKPKKDSRGNGRYCLVDVIQEMEKLHIENINVAQIDASQTKNLEKL